MKQIKLLLLVCILTISQLTQAQFFAGFNTGYDFSLADYSNGVLMIDPLPIDESTSSMYIHPMLYYNSSKEMISIKPHLGSGITNEIIVGYKTGFLGVQLSAGTNCNALNFKNKNNIIGRFESKTFYDINSPDLPYLMWFQVFDQYITLENSYSLDFRYNIFYINPEIFASYSFGRITIGVASGISFNSIDMAIYGKTIMNGYNDTYRQTITNESTFLFNPDKEILENNFNNAVPEKAIISYTLSLNLGYKINEHLELNCNVSYRPLVYTPINLFITENRTTVDENSQISADNDEDIPAQLIYNSFYTCDDFWFEIREYDFTSIGVNIGIKYFLNQNN
ncbi:MAG: hypothetical protein PHH30_04180 [Bacteroidales bacterium]|nr:hypothetical protein [Bacteroidales bacterium]MDD3859706.1 hypothetical protein [Bacteroidales bacterium]